MIGPRYFETMFHHLFIYIYVYGNFLPPHADLCKTRANPWKKGAYYVSLTTLTCKGLRDT